MLDSKENGEVVALGFTGGFIGAVAVLLTARLVLFLGIGHALGLTSPKSFASPYVYRSFVWGGFWGIPLGFVLRSIKGHQKTVGFLYFLAPVAAVLLISLPMAGMGLLGLHGGPGIMVDAIIVHSPYGIVTTLAIAALCGQGESTAGAAARA